MKIKQSLVFVFMMFMKRGAHGLSEKKGVIIMKRNGKVAKIHYGDAEYLEMNDYCKERYAIFLRHWLNGGEKFITDLKRDAVLEVNKYRQHGYMGI